LIDLHPKSDDSQNRSFALPRVAVFVDPPFGGIHYKSTNANETTSLNLGEDMPLARNINNNSKITITFNYKKNQLREKMQSIVQKDLWHKSHSTI